MANKLLNPREVCAEMARQIAVLMYWAKRDNRSMFIDGQLFHDFRQMQPWVDEEDRDYGLWGG